MRVVTDAELERLIAAGVERWVQEHVSLDGPEARGGQIKVRRLEIAATLSEWRRDWFVNGQSRPMADRAELEFEDAQLALEHRRIGADIVAAQAARRVLLSRAIEGELIGMLTERGVTDPLATAAQRIAMKAERT